MELGILRSIKTGFSRTANRVTDKVAGSGLGQELNTLDSSAHAAYGSEKLTALVRRAAADAGVILKSDGALPLPLNAPVAVLGRCQCDWFFVGYGSGGNVHAPYKTNLLDGIRKAGGNLYEPLAKEYEALSASKRFRAEAGFWGHWPFSHPEFTERLKTLPEAAKALADDESSACIVVIGRASGEDRDLKPEKGSWYLTDEERRMLDIAVKSFRRIIVLLNTGGLMDLSWLEEYGDRISAVLLAWLGGQDSGSAAADIIYGSVNPSGRLPDTAAKTLEDYPSFSDFGNKKRTDYREGVFVGYRYFDKKAPDRVLFPFGHGLSYTDFEIAPGGMARTRSGLFVAVKVKNTGSRPGRTSVLLRALLPQSGADKPLSVLVAFRKTRELAPGEEQAVNLSCDVKSLSVFYEDRHAFVLEKGEYFLEANGVHVGGFTLCEDETVETVHSLSPAREELRARIEAAIPEESMAPRTVDRSFADVASGKLPLEYFVADLSKTELEALTRGHGMMNSPLGPGGNAGVFGGVIKPLKDRGVPVATCCDGPAGLRMKEVCTLIPCGTALAASFDTELVEALHEELAHEMEFFGVDVRLAPGMNIHRHPLCGRNFEYFSEDPVLTGYMASAVVRGLADGGKAACPKHFACNNQEAGRNVNDARVSERALREIYLRGFEICVKESMPDLIMTSYNKINGIYSHYNFDLVTTVLRNEWGFEGAVMTDWWMKHGRSPEYKKLRDNAYRVRSQVDLLMPGDMSHFAKDYRSDGTLLATLGTEGGITRAELMRTAKNVLKVILKLKKNEVRV